MPSAARADARDTLSYLRKHPDRKESGWISRADALDAQLLVIDCAWDRWRTERHHLRGGRADGLFYDQLGDALGIGRDSHTRGGDDPRPTRRRRTGRGDPHQPARARLARLDELLRYDEPTQDLTRPGRRNRTFDPDDPRWAWLSKHREELAAVTHGLAAAGDRHAIADRKWLEELVADVVDDALTPATPAILGLAIAEIRTARSVVELTTTHTVHRVLLVGDALRCQFSGIGCRAHWQSAPPPADVPKLVSEIARRRERLYDPRVEQIPSPDTAEPAEVLLFLRRSPSTNRAVRTFDHLAGLSLGNALWWQDRAAELAALRFGLHVGNVKDVLRRQIGASYSISRGQGVQDRVDRLASLTTRGIPDEKQSRDLRNVGRSRLSKEHGWVVANREVLCRAAAALLAAANELAIVADGRDWLDLLASEYKSAEFGTTSLVTFAYAADEVEDALDGSEVTGTADGGMVTATVSGTGELTALSIDPKVVDPDDIETLSDLVIAAVQYARKESASMEKIRAVLDVVDEFPTVKRLRAAARPVEYSGGL